MHTFAAVKISNYQDKSLADVIRGHTPGISSIARSEKFAILMALEKGQKQRIHIITDSQTTVKDIINFEQKGASVIYKKKKHSKLLIKIMEHISENEGTVIVEWTKAHLEPKPEDSEPLSWRIAINDVSNEHADREAKEVMKDRKQEYADFPDQEWHLHINEEVIHPLSMKTQMRHALRQRRRQILPLQSKGARNLAKQLRGFQHAWKSLRMHPKGHEVGVRLLTECWATPKRLQNTKASVSRMPNDRRNEGQTKHTQNRK